MVNIPKTNNHIEIDKMFSIINDTLAHNPYDKLKDEIKHTMWVEQCESNFPVLYLASIFLHRYAQSRNINKYIFATRDCCQWYKIFNKLYPQENISYFHCSRNMFYNATMEKNNFYREYVLKEIGGINNIDNAIFIDIHGTGKRMFEYFSTNYNTVPHYFLLTSTFKKYKEFPQITKSYMKQKKVFNMIFNARGGPIEMLNYDLVGTLQNYDSKGPVRDKIEYDINLIDVYHKCINVLLSKIVPINMSTLSNTQIQNIRIKAEEIFEKIREIRPCISKIIDHVNKHGPENLVPIPKTIPKTIQNLTYNKILCNDATYGLIWDGEFNKEPCVIKMIKIDNSKNVDFNTNDEKPFLHKEFKNKKSVSKEKFLHDVNQIQMLHKYGLAPKIYDFFIKEKRIEYGFIIMQKMDCSLKDILKKRKLDIQENSLIKKMINNLHFEKKIAHNNMKPSNIGVKLNNLGKIIECNFLSCRKITLEKNNKKFSKLIKKDLERFEKHKKLILEGRL